MTDPHPTQKLVRVSSEREGGTVLHGPLFTESDLRTSMRLAFICGATVGLMCGLLAGAASILWR